MTLSKLKNQFIIRILIISIFLLTVHLILANVANNLTTNVFPYIILLFTLLSTFSHFYLLNTASKSFRKFSNAFLLTTTIKHLTYLSFMAFYAFLNRDVAKIFIFNFTVVYFIFTPFDVIMILKQARKIDKTKE